MNWIKNNKKEFVILVLILLIAAFLRLYRISEYMTFLGDEGRDALMIKRILVEKDLPLIGPPTSIGNMYLGPLYYYMMAVPMTIFWLNPVAAAAQVAVIGTITVGLVYYLTRSWFTSASAAVSAFLYAISPVNIIHSRSSWNPNPAPFFALLAIFGMYKVNKSKNFMWLILTGVALAFAVQMHYLALILIPTVGVLWFYELINGRAKKLPQKNLITGTLLGIAIFLLLMSPLLIFDLKYQFVNYHAISSFFTNRETTVNLNIFNTLERIVPIYNSNLVGRYITQENSIVTPVVSILVLLPLFFVRTQWPVLALGIWLSIGILGLALYKQSIFDHYLGFLNPVPFILLGSLFSLKRIPISLLVILFGIIIWLNLQNSPLARPPNNQLKRTQEIAKFVIKEAGNKPFNFALLAKNNYDAAYQFYLDQFGRGSAQIPFEITDQLFVVCEDSQCQPIGHPKYEIAGFGWAKIKKQSNFEGIKVYKLVHNIEGE